MTENYLEKIFEHNNWANLQIIQACSTLSDEQLDAPPNSATKGSIRRTLLHLIHSQQHYLSLLTGVESRFEWQSPPPFEELRTAALSTGEGLLALVRGDPGTPSETQLRTEDGYLVAPWVVVVQVINHANEHREQICSMLTALGVTPPVLDGWTFGEVSSALTPVNQG